MQHLKYIFLFYFLLLPIAPIFSSENLSRKLSGTILLQVESNGEAWYINPTDLNRYYLGRPSDAFDIMQNLGTGIKNADLEKMPIGLISYHGEDNDNDGLINNLEISIGTDPNNKDSDQDGFDDKNEILNTYNPLGDGKQQLDNLFLKNNLGKIFIQTEKNGESWFIDPITKKRYFLGRPTDAFDIMKELGLGINNENLTKIAVGKIKPSINPENNNPPPPTIIREKWNNIIPIVANSIRKNDIENILKYFTPESQYLIEYTMNYLDNEGRLMLGNILSGSTLTKSTESLKQYTAEIYFNGKYHNIYFDIKKQEDGQWLMTGL